MIGNNQKQHKFAVSVIASFWKFLEQKSPSYEVSKVMKQKKPMNQKSNMKKITRKKTSGMFCIP